VNNLLRGFYARWRYRGKPLGFTEFRYEKADMDGFLASTGFEVLRVCPDDARKARERACNIRYLHLHT
jgi:hypothetical protein